MARACFARSDIEKTVEHLRKALTLNKDLEIAQKFLIYLKKNNLLPQKLSGAESTSSE
jgi:hypothetical protein